MLDWLQKIVKLNVCPSVSDYMKMYSLKMQVNMSFPKDCQLGVL